MVSIRTQDGRTYYTKSVRIRGRVTSRYLGDDIIGLVAAHQDLLARLEACERREARRVAEQREDDRHRAEEREVIGVFRRVEELAAILLRSAGFRKHHRGSWRKSRGGPPVGEVTELKPVTETDLPVLVARANAGDLQAVAELRRVHAKEPGRFMAYCPDLVTIALSTMKKRIVDGPGMALLGAAMEDRLQKMRRDLAGPDPSPIEIMMAGRCVMSWFDAYSLDLLAEYARSTPQTDAQVDGSDRRRDRAHARFLSAMKALAYVRRVKLPTLLQVNLPGAQGAILMGNPPGNQGQDNKQLDQ